MPFAAQGPAVEEDLGSPLVAAQVGLPRTSGEVLEWGQVLKRHRLYPTVRIGSGSPPRDGVFECSCTSVVTVVSLV